MIEQLSFSPSIETLHGLEQAFRPACPRCAVPLRRAAPNALHCAFCETTYPRVEDIWRFLPSERAERLQGFVRDYERLRRAEGYGSKDPAYHRSLPYEDLSGRHVALWARRARSFRSFIEWVLHPMETASEQPLRIADLGAGSGWLAYQLARRGNHVVAVDLLTNPYDGLGALHAYPADLLGVQADFDELPFPAASFDLVVFNASLQYSPDAVLTLREALRVLQPQGRLALLDTPLYTDAAQGHAAVAARQSDQEEDHGLSLEAYTLEQFLTYERLARVSQDLGLRWEVHRPFTGWRRALQHWAARLRRLPAPPQYVVLSGARR